MCVLVNVCVVYVDYVRVLFFWGFRIQAGEVGVALFLQYKV